MSCHHATLLQVSLTFPSSKYRDVASDEIRINRRTTETESDFGPGVGVRKNRLRIPDDYALETFSAWGTRLSSLLVYTVCICCRRSNAAPFAARPIDVDLSDRGCEVARRKPAVKQATS